jgi:hypothetical protein
VRLGPITLTQGESIAWFPTGRKGLGLDVSCKMKMVVSKRAAKLAIRTRRSSRGLNRIHESDQLFTLSKVGIDPRLHREIATTTTTTLERTEWRALYL